MEQWTEKDRTGKGGEEGKDEEDSVKRERERERREIEKERCWSCADPREGFCQPAPGNGYPCNPFRTDVTSAADRSGQGVGRGSGG